MNPRVTIAIPVFNGEKFISEAISSVLEQSFGDLEVVISDNNSDDGTEEICRYFADLDSRVNYCRFNENIGAGPNFNRAFELGRGEYFKWHAHDDLLSSNFVENCVAILDQQTDVSLVFGETVCIDSEGDEIDWSSDLFMPPLELDDPVTRFEQAILTAGSCFPVFGLFRTEVLRRSSLLRPYYGSDRTLIAEAALLGKVLKAPDNAIFFNRDHTARSVARMEKADRAEWMNGKADRGRSAEHIQFLIHLIKIARSHGDVVNPSAALLGVARSALTRRQIARYLLDVARYISPSVSQRMRDTILRNRTMRRVFIQAKGEAEP